MRVLGALKLIKNLDRKIARDRAHLTQRCSIVLGPKDDPQDINYDEEYTTALLQSISDRIEKKAEILSRLHEVNINTRLQWKGKEHTLDHLLTLQNKTIPEHIKTMKHLKRASIDRFNSVEGSRVVVMFNHVERDDIIDKLENNLAELDTLLDTTTASLEVDITA